MGIINKVEFRIISLARSGHHGIINWIIGQCHGKICYLNGVKPNSDPYSTHISKDLKNITEKEFNKDREGKTRKLKKDYLLYSYEELPLEEIFDGGFEKNHDKYLGKSGKKIDVLVLRDPFNYFSSRLKLEEIGLYNANIRIKLTNKESRKMLMDLWIRYAKEYLGETNFLKNKKVIINFNKWAQDKSYRKGLAKKLGLKFDDVMMNKVTKAGPGSSFDRLQYANDAGKMKVLDRWKVFVDNPFYREIFRNKEIIRLSRKIFGELDGTKALSQQQPFWDRIFYGCIHHLHILKGRLKYFAKKIIFSLGLRNLIIAYKKEK